MKKRSYIFLFSAILLIKNNFAMNQNIPNININNKYIIYINNKPYDIRSVTQEGNTLLHYAVAHNNIHDVKRLIEMSPALIHIKNNAGKKAVHFTENMEIKNILFNKDRIIQRRITDNFIQATKELNIPKMIQIAYYFKFFEMNIDCMDPHYATALMYASGLRDSDGNISKNNNANTEDQMLYIVTFLLQNGAFIHSCDIWGNTALDFANAYGYQKVAKLLLDKGAIANEKSNIATSFYTAFSYSKLQANNNK